MACRTIDGSQGEGGGQILRTTLALAALLGQEVEVVNIRANRPKPGLRPQHLAAAEALAAITDAGLAGACKGSTRLGFAPRTIRGGTYRFDIATAGATSLLAAAILPPLLFAPQPTTVVLTGGTHVPFSPPCHYLVQVFLPALARLGAIVRAELGVWGWYPEGGGQLVLHVTPGRQLTGWRWPARSALRGLDLTIGLAGLPEHIARREEEQLRHLLPGFAHLLRTRIERPRGRGCGNLLFLRADYGDSVVGFSSVGRRGWPAEAVATAVADEFLAFTASAASVDRHLADQLVLYLALAEGSSGFSTEAVTSHLCTNLAIIEQLLPVRFALEPATGRLQVHGAGFHRAS